MGKITQVQCHTVHDVVQFAVQHQCTIEGGGKHPKIVTPCGAKVPVPGHPGDIARGTLRSIFAMLKAFGVVFVLALLVLGAYMVYFA